MFRLHNAARALLDRYRTRGSASSLLVSRVILLIPLALVSVSFILAAVSVFAGIQKGPLEDYDIMRIDTSRLGHNLVDTIFDAVSFNATELGQELAGSAVRDRLAGSLGPRAVVSEDELPGTKHIKAPRRLLDGLRNLTESVIQAPARVISGLNNFLGETTRSQPAETVQTQQSQTPATQTQQSQTPTPPPPEQPQSTTQQEQTRPSISQPSSTDRSTDRSTDLSSLTSSAAATNTAPPPREPPQSALAVTAAPSSSALFEVAQTVFDKTKEAVKANAALVGDRVADLIIGELQVADWYSLHVIDLCRGDFESRSSSLGMTTAVCDGRYAGRLDPVKDLARQPLNLGSITIDIGKTSLPEIIDNLVDIANGVLFGIFLLYLWTLLLILLAICIVLGSLTFPLSQVVINVNLGITTVATVFSFLSSLATTILTALLVHFLNKVGISVGFSAERGAKFLALTWAMTAMLLLCTGFWIALLTFVRASSALKRKRLWEHTKVAW